MNLDAWLLDLVTCPRDGCGARLAVRPGGGLVACRGCGALYPVLAGVPLLVPEPHAYVAAYRESILATLAEEGRATRPARALVEAFAEAAGPVEPLRFGDDWTTAAGEGAAPPDPAFAAWVAAARARGPQEAMLEMLPARLGTALDVGTGDGALAAALRPRCARLVVADLSLRAALRARGRARRVRGARGALAAVVVDAEALPLRPGALAAITAANLVDLLGDAAAFFAGARAALARGGRLVASVPQPDGLDAQLAAAGLAVEREAAAVPWLRVHHARHVQVYFPRIVAARPLAGGKAPRRGP
jgi:SAM-dependent methyltransferase/uncharacterized protein YbaR (Trm112 family)